MHHTLSSSFKIRNMMISSLVNCKSFSISMKLSFSVFKCLSRTVPSGTFSDIPLYMGARSQICYPAHSFSLPNIKRQNKSKIQNLSSDAVKLAEQNVSRIILFSWCLIHEFVLDSIHDGRRSPKLQIATTTGKFERGMKTP